MALPDTVAFSDFDPVTGPPLIDGWTGNQDPGVTTTLIDAGYAVGDRLTYGGGSVFLPVVFSCVRVANPGPLPPLPDGTVAAPPGGDYLALAFFCSFDLTFDDGDVVVIALKPDVAGTDRTKERRIDVYPVRTGSGAGQAAEADSPPLPGTPQMATYQVRLGRAPRRIDVWAGTGATPPWQAVAPTNVFARCCSWRPGVPTTTSVGTQALPATAGTSFTFNVAAGGTGQFPPAPAVFTVAATDGSHRVIAYTGKTASSFTGCTQSVGGGTIAPGSTVWPLGVGWSFELLLPMTAALGGGAAWIDIHDSFGLYFNVSRLSTFPGAAYSTQYLFPVGTANYITGPLGAGTNIGAGWYGTGLIPALQPSPGRNLGVGVRFSNHMNPELSVGARDVAAAPGTQPGGTIEGATGTHDNRLVAQVENTDPTNAAQNVGVEFRFANWGLPAATFPAWATASGATPDFPPGGVTINSGASTELTYTWLRSRVPSQYGPHWHQCVWARLVWARLSSTQTVNFVEAGVRRNVDFEHLSTLERKAEISGAGYGPPATGSRHELVLIPHVRELAAAYSDEERVGLAAHIPRAKRVWAWIVDGGRRIDRTITVEGTTAEILDATPGQFGLVLQHDVAGDVLTYELAGRGVKRIGGGAYGVRVRPERSLRVNVRIRAASPEELARDRPSWRRKGCVPLVIIAVVALGALLRRLLRR